MSQWSAVSRPETTTEVITENVYSETSDSEKPMTGKGNTEGEAVPTWSEDSLSMSAEYTIDDMVTTEETSFETTTAQETFEGWRTDSTAIKFAPTRVEIPSTEVEMEQAVSYAGPTTEEDTMTTRRWSAAEESARVTAQGSSTTMAKDSTSPPEQDSGPTIADLSTTGSSTDGQKTMTSGICALVFVCASFYTVGIQLVAIVMFMDFDCQRNQWLDRCLGDHGTGVT